jgi:hypothetical protein
MMIREPVMPTVVTTPVSIILVAAIAVCLVRGDFKVNLRRAFGRWLEMGLLALIAVGMVFCLWSLVTILTWMT